MIDKFLEILNLLLGILPNDPIVGMIDEYVKEIDDYLGYINYFIPFRLISDTMRAWTSCMAAYFTWVVGRKAIMKYSDKLIGAVGGLKNILGIGG